MGYMHASNMNTNEVVNHPQMFHDTVDAKFHKVGFLGKSLFQNGTVTFQMESSLPTIHFQVLLLMVQKSGGHQLRER